MTQPDQPNLHCKKALSHIRNATVTPTILSMADRTFSGCVYDGAGCIVTASQRTSKNVIWKPIDPITIATDGSDLVVEGQSIYLGHYTNHYGHFLLETLSRFWALRRNISIDKYVFHRFVHQAKSPHSFSPAFSPARICFECFGIELKHAILINQRIIFKHLIVPTMLFEINNYANEDQALIYNQIADYCESRYGKQVQLNLKHNNLIQPKKLYLSRKSLGVDRFVVNVTEVEMLFSSLGFTVIYPEKMSFEEQVVLYRGAEILAGFQGSAMHNSVFMKKGSLVINIGDMTYPNNVNRNQLACDKLSKVRPAFIRFCGHVVDRTCNKSKFDISYLRFEVEQLL